MTARRTPLRSAGPRPRAGRPVPVAGPGKSANPQLRLVTLIACGTRGLLDAAIGPARGKGTGERALAGQLLGSLQAGMLLLADRNFYSYQLWNAAAATGADLLWRVRDSMHLPVVRPAAGRIVSRARQRPARGAGQSAQERHTPAPRQPAAARYRAAARHHGAGHRVRPHRHRRRRQHPRRAVPAPHHADRLARAPGRGPGRRVRLAVGDRDRIPRVQDLPARIRPRAQGQDPGPGPAGTLGAAWSSTRPSASSSSAPPPAAAWIRTGSPSPPP